ncbi:MAG: PhzF family phenazine biosynthesis protein [Deltaproteobacteria bacterium]
MKVYILNSFAKTINGGNPAGVVLDADCLTDNDMLNISKKVGFSETAFIQKSEKADFKVRFFTPVSEVDLCGHATIATFSLLKDLDVIKEGKYSQETKAGVLNIDINDSGIVFMNQNLPKFYDIIDKEQILDCLNIKEEHLVSKIPIQVVSTGLRDIIVSVKTIESLFSVMPDFEKIKHLSKKYDVIGIHAFTLETKFNSTAHCRNFAPLYDVPEESATGTSNGALACYMFKYFKEKISNTQEMRFEQGYIMDRPSEVLVWLSTKNNDIAEVRVGGIAIRTDDINV